MFGRRAASGGEAAARTLLRECYSVLFLTRWVIDLDEIQQGEGRPLKYQRKHPEELRAVIAITRHGDRTPKQKMKMKISFPEFLAFYNKYSPGERRAEQETHF